MRLTRAGRWFALTVSLFSLQTQVKLAKFMQYRVDFAIGVLLSLGLSAMTPLLALLIYSKTRGFPGWTLQQILVFQSVLLLTSGIRQTLFGDVRAQISQLVDTGEFDRLLLKPCPPLMLLLTGGFSPHSIGTMVVGGGLGAWSWVHSGARLSLTAFVLFVLLVLCGVLVSVAANVLYCTLTLRWTYALRLDETLDKVLRFGDFPLDVYPKLLQPVFLTLLPLSVVTNWPAQALLGRLGIGSLVAVAGAVSGCFLMTWCWGRQLRHYESAGG